MKLVIADTGPINYLLLTGYIDLLPALFERIILPPAVRDELSNPETPAAVRNWIATPPQWLKVQHASGPEAVTGLGAGETEAITLALELHADLLLMDDRRGVKAARSKGIDVTGTLGVLSLAGPARAYQSRPSLRTHQADQLSLPPRSYGSFPRKRRRQVLSYTEETFGRDVSMGCNLPNRLSGSYQSPLWATPPGIRNPGRFR